MKTGTAQKSKRPRLGCLVAVDNASKLKKEKKVSLDTLLEASL